MSALAAVEASRAYLDKLARLDKIVARARDPKRRHHRAALRRRLLLEQDWADALKGPSDALFALVEPVNLDNAVAYAQHSWAEKGLFRKDRPSPDEAEVRSRLAFGIPEDVWITGAVQVYLGMAIQTAQEAGQFSLDRLGLNKTWAFAHPRSMANDLFAVRGSKVVQSMYGTHMDTLSRIIVAATDPRNPKTIQEVRAEIKRLWPELQRYQVDRIARTETAAVWSTTAANAYQANGITQFESSVAHGPTIGVESEMPCEECEAAATLVHDITDDIPPWHPNCRCEVIPVLVDEDGSPWLPPQEPFTGADAEGLRAAESLEAADAAFADLEDLAED